ncbi:MAG: TRAP transporter small permease [Rhodocyclales bacterium]|nr:TRAP transporter small permease [Rhodocyclales bacterium]
MSEPMGQVLSPVQDPYGRAVFRLAAGFALGGGLVLLAIALMSVASVLMRSFGMKPIPGDFELVQLGCAVCVSMFLPYCQMRRGHVMVDFFTVLASGRAKAVMDAGGALLLALAAALLSLRLVSGMLDSRASGEATMILGVPIWWAYVPMIPSFALLAVAGLYTAMDEWRKVKP